MSERSLLAAQGYLELGMVEEALGELAAVHTSSISDPDPGPDPDPDLIELRLHILMQGERWSDALASAKELLLLNSSALPAYIHGAFALHELGRTTEARDLLLRGPEVLGMDPTYHYNIACYEAVLGNNESAKRSLEKSFALDETYRDFAKQDPDLEAIRSELE
jgi:tetratricopeptide (TPR) repeat protein